jgi:sporulation protein YlmC with PRC-barrel domain
MKSTDFLDKDVFALDERIGKIKEIEVDLQDYNITHLEVELDKDVAESVLGVKKGGVRNMLNVSALEKGTGIWMDNGLHLKVAKDQLHRYLKPAVRNSGNEEDSISDLKIVKILSQVPKENEFRFYIGIDQNTGETAEDLETFAEKLEEIDIDSVKFHFQRNDFQEWIEHTVGDDVLAKEISQINKQLFDEDIREKLVMTVKARIAKLKLLHGELIPSNKL